ncbi:hypothetical protein BU17DRAFT_44645 [Hysterangium stoloniferum]|nr:hypothetical protein BU17DRAFT_44645 [Hysterangium stoloniferum]
MPGGSFQRLYAHFWGRDRVDIVSVAGKNYSIVDLTPFDIPQNSRPANILFIREEYRLAYDTILTDTLKEGHRRSAFLVTGQPGIGKTLFLLYLLVRRLQNQDPVALQIDANEFILFSEDGVSRHSGGAYSADDIPKGAWALSDSSDELQLGPCGAFQSTRVHVIHTSSPSSRRWKDWVKRLTARRYIMDIWSLEELRTFIVSGLDVEAGMALSEKYGPNPRSIVSILIEPSEEETYLDDVRTGAVTLAGQFPSIFLDLESLDFSSNISSKIFTVRPKNLISRRPTLYIPTPFLASTLGVAVSAQTAAQQHSFFALLSGHPSLRSAAGWVFESYARVRFSGPNPASLQGYLPGDPNPHPIPTPSRVISGTTALQTIQSPFNFYWRPRESNFKGVDALIRSDNIVWALQFTISASHSSATKGLNEVSKIMNHKRDVEWRLVIVGPNMRGAESARDRQVLTGRWKDTNVYACELPLGEFEENEQQQFEFNMNEVNSDYYLVVLMY